MAKIIMIMPYFGKWPEWINLYFYSCGQNKLIDFYFFTDCDIPENYAGNLYFQKISFQDYCRMVSEKLDINFSPETPYKLCDVRPFYGFIHADLTERYEFWAFGDVDVVWGDIAAFYSDKLLKKYDVFSTHADRISGHFCVIRNIGKYRNMAFKIRNWRKKLQSGENFIIDESAFSTVLYPMSKIIRNIYIRILSKIFCKPLADSIYTLVKSVMNFLFLSTRKIYFKEQYTTPQVGNRAKTHAEPFGAHPGLSFEYTRKSLGKYAVIDKTKQRELIYLHFLKFKYVWKENFYQTPDIRALSDNFSIKIDENRISKV